MVKKTVVVIIAALLLAVMSVAGVYYSSSTYANVNYPYSGGTYTSSSGTSGGYYPISMSYAYSYPYGNSYTSYPTSNAYERPRAIEGTLCGKDGSKEYGCQVGLTCDYSQTSISNVGVCMRPTATYTPQVNYPYAQVGYTQPQPQVNYPYYGYPSGYTQTSPTYKTQNYQYYTYPYGYYYH